MSLLGYISDRLLFAAGLLVGAQAPLFIAAYQQRLEGRLEQARDNLAGWQAIADRLHGGSLQALLARHRESADPTFAAEARLLQDLVRDVQRLDEAATALDGQLPMQLYRLATHFDASIARGVLEHFQPGFLFTTDALLLAVLSGFAFSVAGRVLSLPLRRLAAASSRAT